MLICMHVVKVSLSKYEPFLEAARPRGKGWLVFWLGIAPFSRSLEYWAG